MDELTRLELNRRLMPLKNSELLTVIHRKEFVRDVCIAEREEYKSIQEEIDFARKLYVMRMGL